MGIKMPVLANNKKTPIYSYYKAPAKKGMRQTMMNRIVAVQEMSSLYSGLHNRNTE